jgi:hypothetical protein
MNYQLSSALLSFFRDETFVDNDHNTGSSAGTLAPLTPTGLSERLLNLQERYPPEAFQALMNLLGSHDTSRPLFMLDHNADQNNAALYANPAYDWSDAINRLKGVTLLQATLPGAPTIYYGDEVGLVGPPTYDGSTWQDDPYNRVPYPWLDETGTPFYAHLQTVEGQATVLDHYKVLFNVRNEHEALATGDLRFLVTDDADEALAYGRKLGQDGAVVVVNRADAPQSVVVDVGGYLPVGGAFHDVLNGDAAYTVGAGGTLTVSVAANSGALLVASAPLPTAPSAIADLAVTPQGSAELRLSWTSQGGAQFNVLRSLLSGGGYETVHSGVPAASGSAETFSDAGLDNGTTYHYVIQTVNAEGLTSEYSNEASGTPGFDLSASGSTWFNLQWPPTITHTISTSDETDTIYGQIWIDGQTSAPGATPGVRAQVGYGPDGTQPDSSWAWKESAFSSDQGNNDEFATALLPTSTGNFDYAYRWSGDGGLTWFLADINGPQRDGTLDNPGSLTVNASSDITSPSAPTLSLAGVDASSVDLSWTASSDGVAMAGYEIYRDGSLIDSVDDTVTTYSDENVTTGESYAYTVKAFDTSFNRSDASNEVQVTVENRTVSVTFHVAVPDFTPDDATVYVTGSADAIGPWAPGAHALTEGVDGTWSGTFNIPDGTSLEYKYTRGSWETVENWGSITGLANRGPVLIQYGTDGTQTIDNTATTGPDSDQAVGNWRDPLVASFTPADDATDVDPATDVVVTWSRSMDTSAASMSVTGPGGAVGGNLAFSTNTVANDTYTFTPSSDLAAGEYTVTLSSQRDVEGNVQQVGTTFTFTVAGSTGGADTTAPVVGDVHVILRQGGQMNSVPITISWSASDETSADSALVNQLQYRRYANGTWGAWKPLPSVTGAESTNLSLAIWSPFEFRVRTRDEALNWSGWSTSVPFKAIRRQEKSLTFSSGWAKRVAMSGASKGYVARSSTPGATATIRLYGDGLSPVMPALSGQGTVEVCVDAGTANQLCQTVNLGTFTPRGARRLVATFTDLPEAWHILRVKVVSGTVNLDGAVLSQNPF